MKSIDLVSVVITTYNRRSLLVRALDSVTSQTYNNIEIIIVDDCSDDDISSFISDYFQKANNPNKFKIRLIVNDVNRGACYCRNVGIQAASGKFIAGLDDDDEFTSDRIEKLVRSYRDDYAFVCSNTKVVSKESSFSLFKNSSDIAITHKESLWENRIGTQVLVERQKIIDCGCFDVNLSSAQDADMWVRLIKKYGPALRVKECLYVLHTEHDEPRISTSGKKIKGLKDFYVKHKNDMSPDQQSYSEFKHRLWENDNKLSFNLLFRLNFNALLFMFKKMAFGKK